MSQGTDNPELGEKGDTTGTLKLWGRTGQMRADPRQGDLRGVRLENHQVSFQLLEGQAALLVETSGGDDGSARCRSRRQRERQKDKTLSTFLVTTTLVQTEIHLQLFDSLP